ncbi:SUKH-3 domain-containing protein [Pseudoalteromonas rhizosphaerae]|uniref:SUKH-3 domain-containing protein n=1 Tax=Pseudoalteromonas rhizosphaerae TaxID=2518973 RepID=A0ABW8L172_9GAMM
MNTEEYLDKLFFDAGWYEGRYIELDELRDSDTESHLAAVKILKEYGGLSVGETGPGRECAASDIEFYKRLRYEADGLCKEWGAKIGKLVAIANAHHQHIIVLVDSQSNLYIYTDPNEQLYYGGSFYEATAKLLLGLDYGCAIEKA